MNLNRKSFLVSCLTMVFAMSASLMIMSSEAYAKSAKNEVRLEGTLVAKNVAAGLLSIRKQGGAIVKVTVPASAKVERNDVHSTIAAFKIGDFVQTRSVNGTVVKAEAVGP